MRGSRDKKPAGIALPLRLEAFLEMLAAERGAARLTLAAYGNDLVDLAGFLAARGIDPAARFLAVALNGAVVRRASWSEAALNTGDAVEIVRPLQGG